MTKRKDKKSPIKFSAKQTTEAEEEKVLANEEPAEETVADEVLIEQAQVDQHADEIVIEDKQEEANQKQTKEAAQQKPASKENESKSKKNDDRDKKKPKKEKKERKGLKRRTKETVSELKKVIWPKFPEVVKKTGVVLVVVLIFAVVLLGLDLLLGYISSLLMPPSV